MIAQSIDSLLKKLCETPEDWTLRLVLADAYEEASEPEYAQCMRWASEHKKRAYRSGPITVHWYDGSRNHISGLDPESDLPITVYKEITGEETDRHKQVANRLLSEKALLVAFKKALQKGWVP